MRAMDGFRGEKLNAIGGYEIVILVEGEILEGFAALELPKDVSETGSQRVMVYGIEDVA